MFGSADSKLETNTERSTCAAEYSSRFSSSVLSRTVKELWKTLRFLSFLGMLSINLLFTQDSYWETFSGFSRSSQDACSILFDLSWFVGYIRKLINNFFFHPHAILAYVFISGLYVFLESRMRTRICLTIAS